MKQENSEQIFLATYRPLCGTRAGREAVAQYGIAPFVDGSCRREPDFENDRPSITALCRGSMFAPRLQKDHRIAYVTKRGNYGNVQESHWRLKDTACFSHARFSSSI